jgi:flagellar basal-body rod modification protein FlgD
MDVSSTAAITNARISAASQSKNGGTVDYNAFLQLLIAEMRNQDPTEPMKSSEYMAQFASFSNVEQAIQINTKLDSLLTATALNQADALLGKKITSADGKITGVVKSLKVVSGGLVAVLDSGKELLIGPGVKIEPPPPPKAS